MRPRYGTSSIVLARTPLAEASTLLYLLTHDFGLVKARAQGLRKSGAKLAAALQTLVESDAILVRGKDGWRLSGALLVEDWFGKLPSHARLRAGRIARLLLRLVQGETSGPALFHTYRTFIEVLPALSEDDGEAAEYLVASRLLAELGLDSAPVVEGDSYGSDALTFAKENRRDLITRINRGITASGL